VHILLLFVAVTASAQSLPSDIKAESIKLYSDARPYMNESLPELKKVVRELGKLSPASNQVQPSDLLSKFGMKADELLQQVPNLISNEEVIQSQHQSQEMALGCEGCAGGGNTLVKDSTFNYLLLTHPGPDGRLRLQEYRTNLSGKTLHGTGSLIFQGFISAWIIFSSADQVESRFRYLGEQRTDGRSTFVIGFAQVPGAVESPGQIVANGASVPMLLQGIVWVDQSDFRIVRLRTDLLAPQPDLLIQRQTANILFGKVHIAGLEQELWLPQTVHVEMEARGQIFQEQHKYSKYRLYKANSRITFCGT
jgi:hypothetical protein